MFIETIQQSSAVNGVERNIGFQLNMFSMPMMQCFQWPSIWQVKSLGHWLNGSREDTPRLQEVAICGRMPLDSVASRSSLEPGPGRTCTWHGIWISWNVKIWKTKPVKNVAGPTSKLLCKESHTYRVVATISLIDSTNVEVCLISGFVFPQPKVSVAPAVYGRNLCRVAC